MYQETGTLTPTPPFDFSKSLQFLGIFGPTKNEQTVSTQSLTKAISIDGQTVVFQLTSIGTTENPSLAYALFSADPFSEATKSAVIEHITFFLSLQDDLEPFYRIGGIGEWSATFIMVRGLGRMERVPLTEARLFEAASKVYGHGEELSRDDLKRLADKYGLWQGYWAHYIRVAS